jgi:hypothetical protein
VPVAHPPRGWLKFTEAMALTRRNGGSEQPKYPPLNDEVL